MFLYEYNRTVVAARTYKEAVVYKVPVLFIGNYVFSTYLDNASTAILARKFIKRRTFTNDFFT